MENILSDESAQDQLNKFVEYYEIEPSYMPAKQRESIEAALLKLKRAIMKGKIEIRENNDKLEVIQFRKDKPEIVYKTFDGKHKEQMKNAEEGNHMGRIYEFLGALSGLGKTSIAKLEGADLSTAENLGSIFLLV